MTFTGIPSDPRRTPTNEEWRIDYDSAQPTVCTVPARLLAPADQGGRQGEVRLPARDCLPQDTNQGKKSLAQGRRGDDQPLPERLHEHHGDQGQSLPRRQASRHPSLWHHHRRRPAARNWHLDVMSTNPLGVTNQERSLSRAALGWRSTTPAKTSSLTQRGSRPARAPSTTRHLRGNDDLAAVRARDERRAGEFYAPLELAHARPEPAGTSSGQGDILVRVHES